MAMLDEVERARLELLVPGLERAVKAGIGGQSMVGTLNRLKGRLENLEAEFGPGIDGRNERKERAAMAEMIAVHNASISMLSAEAQEQFDGFLTSGFRSRKDLDKLSLFLTENSEDLNFGQRVQIVDEVLDGVERKDYEIDETPDNVIAEVQTVLKDPAIYATVMANLSTKDSAALNAALASDDPSRLRAALKNERIFEGAHRYVDDARRRIEAQERTPEAEPTQEESKSENVVERDGELDEFDSMSEEFAKSAVTPTDLRNQKPSQIGHS